MIPRESSLRVTRGAGEQARGRPDALRDARIGMACAAAAVALLGPAPAPAGAPVDRGAPGATVPLWGRFETRLRNAKAYANPFRDVELQAIFTSPKGRTVRFLGFHDGDGVGGQRGLQVARHFCWEAWENQ